MTYQIDAQHSAVHFKVRHMTIANIKGSFHGVTGSVEFDAADPTKSKVEASIDIASLRTGDPMRDGHMQNADFFDVPAHPTARFVSKSIAKGAEGRWKVTGDLTLRGVTREVVLNTSPVTEEAKDPWGNLRRGLEATVTINRADYGLKWNVAIDNGFMLSDEVELTIDIELLRKPE